MKIVNLNQYDEILAVFESSFPIAILEFSSVYGLISPNSIIGAESIDFVKKRLSNKVYGSLFTNDPSLNELIENNYIKLINDLTKENIKLFVRFPIQSQIKIDKIVSKDQSHQTLLEHPKITSAFEQILIQYKTRNNKSDFFEKNYQSPIISSLNISGAQTGAITNDSEALDFGVKQGIPLFIKTGLLTPPYGSYPIYSVNFETHSFSCHRNGPNSQDIEQLLSSRLAHSE